MSGTRWVLRGGRACGDTMTKRWKCVAECLAKCELIETYGEKEKPRKKPKESFCSLAEWVEIEEEK